MQKIFITALLLIWHCSKNTTVVTCDKCHFFLTTSGILLFHDTAQKQANDTNNRGIFLLDIEVPMVILKSTSPKKYFLESKTLNKTRRFEDYKKMCLCNNCCYRESIS